MIQVVFQMPKRSNECHIDRTEDSTGWEPANTELRLTRNGFALSARSLFPEECSGANRGFLFTLSIVVR